MISYQPLWETVKREKITTYTLINTHDISKGTIDRLKNNRNVTLQTIEDLCHILGCPIENVVEIK